MALRRVVLTGIGPYIYQGKGKEALWETVVQKNHAVQAIPDHYEVNYKFKSKFFVPFPDISFEETGLHKKYRSITDHSSQLAIICARLALEDAGYTLSPEGEVPFYNEDLHSAAILLGTGIGHVQSVHEGVMAHAYSQYEELMEELQFSTHFNRMVVPMIMPNSLSSWVSILFGIHGPNYTLNSACSSGNYALGEAYRKIKDGYHDLVLAGGVENFEDNTGAIMRSFDCLGTLTRSKDGKPGPFSENRSGFLFSDGAGCVLILEEYNRAVQRNAPIYAEVAGYEASSDAKNLVLMDTEGKDISYIIQKLKQGHDIDYINAHGTATQPNDAIEARLFLENFGEREYQPFINSSKGILGHTISASAALEAAICALSIKHEKVHANVLEEPMKDINVTTDTVDCQVDTALSLSYGFGGHNSGLLLKKCKH